MRRIARRAGESRGSVLTPRSVSCQRPAMRYSLIDFDLLARVDPSNLKISGPSIYSEMVWEARKLRAQVGLAPTDWVVVRNRMPVEDHQNKRRVGDLLEELSRRIGFRVSAGLSDRIIFRELFLSGLTLLDLRGFGSTKRLRSPVCWASGIATIN